MRFSKKQRTTIIQLLLITLLVAVGIGMVIEPVQGQSDLQGLVDSIESVEQVKEDLRQTLKFRDECAVGVVQYGKHLNL